MAYTTTSYEVITPEGVGYSFISRQEAEKFIEQQKQQKLKELYAKYMSYQIPSKTYFDLVYKYQTGYVIREAKPATQQPSSFLPAFLTQSEKTPFPPKPELPTPAKQTQISSWVYYATSKEPTKEEIKQIEEQTGGTYGGIQSTEKGTAIVVYNPKTTPEKLTLTPQTNLAISPSMLKYQGPTDIRKEPIKQTEPFFLNLPSEAKEAIASYEVRELTLLPGIKFQAEFKKYPFAEEIPIGFKTGSEPGIYKGEKLIIRPFTIAEFTIGQVPNVASSIIAGGVLGVASEVAPTATMFVSLMMGAESVGQFLKHYEDIERTYREQPTAPLMTAIGVMGGIEAYKAGKRFAQTHIKVPEYRYEIVVGEHKETEKLKMEGFEAYKKIEKPIVEEIASKEPLYMKELEEGWTKITAEKFTERVYGEEISKELSGAGLKIHTEYFEPEGEFQERSIKAFKELWVPKGIGEEIKLSRYVKETFYPTGFSEEPLRMQIQEIGGKVKTGIESFEWLKAGIQQQQKEIVVSSKLQEKWGVALTGMKETKVMPTFTTLSFFKAQERKDTIQIQKSSVILELLGKGTQEKVAQKVFSETDLKTSKDISKIERKEKLFDLSKVKNKERELNISKIETDLIKSIDKLNFPGISPPPKPSPPPFSPPKLPSFELPEPKFPKLFGKQKITKAILAKREKKYEPSLLGLMSGKEIKKIPEKKFTGFEIRYPLKSKKSKKLNWSLL